MFYQHPAGQLFLAVQEKSTPAIDHEHLDGRVLVHMEVHFQGVFHIDFFMPFAWREGRGASASGGVKG